jgi:hypothetical protein
MNLMEKYARVRFHVNRTRSARFHRNRDLDVAINLAILDIINDRYDAIKRKRGYNFEAVMRVRNELSSIVVIDQTLALSGSSGVKPTDWMYTLQVSAVINGTLRHCEPMDFNEYGPHLKNNLMRPISNLPKYTEDSNVNILYGGGLSSVSGVYMTYIKKPSLVSSGSAISSGLTALTIGLEYGVVSGSITYNSVVYNQDDYFTANAGTAFTGTGTVAVLNNTDLGYHLHEEICRRAAVLLMGNVQNVEKIQIKKVESEES